MKFFILLLTTLITATCIAQQRLDSILNKWSNKQHFNGVALVAINGKIEKLYATGIADRTTQTPIKTDSKFRIASMTKVFTAVLVMKLVEEGRIVLDKTIGVYFPSSKGEGRDKVTIHQLLTYSSGIENRLEPLGILPYQKKKTLDQFIDEYCSGKIVDEPGTKSVYGNTEYIILQKIIELVTEKSYVDYLQEKIIQPLQLKNTGIINSSGTPPKLLMNYLYNDSTKSFTKEQDYFAENYFAAGNMYSTAEDLLRFSNAIFSYKLLSKEATDRMLVIHPALAYTAYGFWGSDGWGTFNEKFYYRTGGILGATSNWIVTMGSRKTIIILSNTDATNLYGLSEELYK